MDLVRPPHEWLTTAPVHNLPANLTIVSGLVTFQLKPQLLTSTGVVSVASVIVFGLVPALWAARTDLLTPLKEGEGADLRPGTRRGVLGARS